MLPVQSFLQFIHQNQLFNQDDRILLGLSGGRDSVMLAWLLKSAGFDFGIAHCNFQLRSQEAVDEQAFARQLASKLGAPFYTIDFETKLYASQQHISIQMAARDLRYTWFEKIRYEQGYHYIALAHHQNDSVETILLNLTRGTGIAGMHGILPKNGLLVRPLLFLTREEIDAVVSIEGLEYMEDSSNASIKYARNKIRHEVVPVLKQLNPALEKTFDSNMRRFKELEQLLQKQVSKLHEELFVAKGNGIHVPIEAIKNLDPQHLLFYNLLSPYGFTETVVDDVISSLHKHSGRQFSSASHNLLLDRTHLILTKKQSQMETPVIIDQHTHEIVFAGFKLVLLHDDSPLIVANNPMATSVDAAKLVFPLTLRHWQEGDHFYPLGMSGKQKLSDFFIHQKVPVNQKIDVLVLVNGNGEVIWIGGYRLDERYKVSATTKKVVIFELYKLNQ